MVPGFRAARVLLALTLVAVPLAGTVSSCAGSAACRYNSDCNNAYCSNGLCKQDCINAAVDCMPGQICDAVAQCVYPVGDAGRVQTDGGVLVDSRTDASRAPDDASRDGSPHDAASHPDATTTPDAGSKDVAPSPDTSGARKTEFDLCGSTPECASGLLCEPLYVNGLPRCTRTCTTTAQCMESTRCVTVGADQYCVWSDIGRSCVSSSTCNFGCLTTQQYCTMPCASGSDCPNGYGCQAVGTPAVSVCVKAEVPCDASDTSGCIAAAACDTSATLVVAGCTLACSSASDCPQRAQGLAPWTCDASGICRRPADVFGPEDQGSTPAQYACDADGVVVNMCNDAQHMDFTTFTIPAAPAVSCSATTTTNGTAGDSCVDSCLYQGTCAFGYACTAVGSVGSDRIGLCLPALSGGEIGASCATDGDCFFGYCNRTAGTCSRDCTADGLCTTGSSCVADGSTPVEGLPWKRCQ